MVLETAKERVKLLKSGMTGKQIEGAYVELNDFKIIDKNLLPIQEA